jgi:nitrogen-specific signal transduction histidine kinase
MNHTSLTARATEEQLLFSRKMFYNDTFYHNFIDGLSDIVIIINKERQILYANKVLLDLLCINDSIDLLGIRYGEALNCVNAKIECTGCGTSKNCCVCGFLNTIIESQEINKKVTKDATIVRQLDGKRETLQYQISCTPLQLTGSNCWMLHLEDLSETFRKSSLDNIFFHDILNTSGLINGMSSLILKLDDGKQANSKYLRILSDLSKRLIDEINAQKIMSYAENGKLVIDLKTISIFDFLQETISYLSFHFDMENKQIKLETESKDCEIKTDSNLLRRVIINMVKNAIEASNKNENIVIGCKYTDNSILIHVNNKGVIPIGVQKDIFKRFVSTKAKTGRGLGTYSIKLITEQYLGGKAYFTSTEQEGTCFYVKLPIN